MALRSHLMLTSEGLNTGTFIAISKPKQATKYGSVLASRTLYPPDVKISARKPVKKVSSQASPPRYSGSEGLREALECLRWFHAGGLWNTLLEK